MTKERALDIFDLLAKLDRKQFHLWETLSKEQQKEFSALISMRWMAGTTDKFQLMMLNEIINTTVIDLPKQKELMMKLLAVCSNGSQKRYTWAAYKVGGAKKARLAVQLVADYYRLSEEEAEDTIKLFSPSEILELGEEMGLQKDELKELQKELK